MIAVHEESVDVIFVIRGDAGFPRRYCVLRQGTAQHGPDPFGQQKVRARLANEIIRTRFQGEHDASARRVHGERGQARDEERGQQLHWPRASIPAAPAPACSGTRALAK